MACRASRAASSDSAIRPTTSSALARRCHSTRSSGSRERVLQFGYTEPYLFDKPIQAGFTDLFKSLQLQPSPRGLDLRRCQSDSRSSTRSARRTSSTTGRIPLDSRRFVSYPLRRSFARLSLTYSFRRSSVVTFSQVGLELVHLPQLRRRVRPQLAGRASPPARSRRPTTTTPLTTPSRPRRARSLYASFAVAGFGGNARFIQPTVEAKYFRPARQPPHHRDARPDLLPQRLRRARPSALSIAPSWVARTTCAASRSGRSARWFGSRTLPPCRSITTTSPRGRRSRSSTALRSECPSRPRCRSTG